MTCKELIEELENLEEDAEVSMIIEAEDASTADVVCVVCNHPSYIELCG